MESGTFKAILEFSFLRLGSKFNLTVLNVLQLIILFVLTFLTLLIIKKVIYRSKKLHVAKKILFQ